MPHIEDASFGNVRAAVANARLGVSTHLEGNVGMTVKQAQEFARSLLANDSEGAVSARIDGIWLLIEPARPSST
jgi:hypothetical protein